MEGLAHHEVASIIDSTMYLPFGFWEVPVEEVGPSRAIVNKLPPAPPTKLRSDAAPARTSAFDLNLTHHSGFSAPTYPACLPYPRRSK